MRLAIEAAQLDALLTVPERHAERARLRRGDRRVARGRPAAASVSCSRIARGSASSSARPAPRPARRWRWRRWKAGCCSADAHRRAGVRDLRARADGGRSSRGRGRDRSPCATRRCARGSLRLRVAAAWYAAEHALRVGRVARCRELTPGSRSSSSTRGSTRSPAARSRCWSARSPSAARSTRRTSCCATYGLDGALGHAALADRRPPCPRAAVRWPRATSSARTPRRSRPARCARPRAARTRRWRRGARPRRWRSPTSAAATRRQRVAEAELALAMRFGAPLPIAGALHARAVAEPDPAARVALCERALAVVASMPGGLESVRAAARARQRARVPRPPRRGARRAAAGAGRRRRGGRGAARPSALAASSWRPGCGRARRRSEGTAALTPRQRQICELAAVGKGNRAIAQELFLSGEDGGDSSGRGVPEARRERLARGWRRSSRRPRRAAWTSRIGLRARLAERLAPRKVRLGDGGSRGGCGALPLGQLTRVNLVATGRRT